jgi:CubicO group peptidase (beta-lactamase class C family)
MEATTSEIDFDDLAERWQARLPELAAVHDVPGAALGVLRLATDARPRQQFVAAAGVLNLDTGLACTTDSVFQIGSITKSWTATVVMRLIEQGLLELDAPLADVLPGLRLPDDLAARATMRHLLTHTSGMDGDLFTDTGRGDDSLERYVELLADAGMNHPLGATFSYCNAGYILAGRIIEHVTGQTWDAAIGTHIVEPLELTRTFTFPEECMLGRFAVGHVAENGQKPHVAPIWALPRSLGPAGLITCTAGDVLAFAAMHLGGGAPVLAPSTAAAMQEHQVDVPDPYTLGESWGLGWIRFAWDGRHVIGHDGNTIGQAAYLRMVPELGLAVTLLTNGGESADLFQDVITDVLAEVAGIAVPARVEPTPSAPLGEVADYLGHYSRASLETDVYLDGERLMLRTTSTGPLAELDENPIEEHELFPIRDGVYALREPPSEQWTPVVFYRLDDGKRYVHFGARANPWVSA